MDRLRLCLVTDRSATRGRDLVGVVRECVTAGLPAVQLREKDLSALEVLQLATDLRECTAAAGAWLIVNDRADVALAAGADGVQRTHASLPVEALCAAAGARLRVGASVHSLDEARAAARAGAAWLFFGPVYDTPSKRAYGAPQGLAALAQVVRSVDIPVIAIGGITAERVPEVHAAGAAGIAVISAILAADSPGDATRRLLAAIEATRSREAFTRDVAPTPRAVVLLSGGLDSTTLLALARREGFAVHALTFRYGQRHAVEIEAARRVAARGGAAEHRIVEVDLRAFGGSALTADIAVPKDRAPADMGHDIPITYVPARNTIFLSFALAWAEVLGAADIFIGVNALDYSGYPDCRPEYIAAYEGMANLATKAAVEGRQRVRIHTPLIGMTKAEIIRRGLELDVDYALTLSCYDPAADGAACGRCDACRLRLKGFAEAGRQDPAIYRTI